MTESALPLNDNWPPPRHTNPQGLEKAALGLTLAIDGLYEIANGHEIPQSMRGIMPISEGMLFTVTMFRDLLENNLVLHDPRQRRLKEWIQPYIQFPPTADLIELLDAWEKAHPEEEPAAPADVDVQPCAITLNSEVHR